MGANPGHGRNMFDAVAFRIARHILVRPTRKKFALSILGIFPGLRNRLKTVVLGTGVYARSAPDARRIYSDLLAEIERTKQKGTNNDAYRH